MPSIVPYRPIWRATVPVMDTYRFTDRDGNVTTAEFETKEAAIEHTKSIDRGGRGVRVERQEWKLVEFHDGSKA